MNSLIIFLFYIFIISIIVIIYLERGQEKGEVVYITSTFDDNEYLVRDLPDKLDAANMLAEIKYNMFKLKDYLVKHKNDYPEYKQYIEQLDEKLTEDSIINESDGDSAYTSYSVNKGEQIVFCIRSKHNGTIHSLNLLMYVAIHEMSHIACPDYGHGPLFQKIFAFLLGVAIKLNIYTKIDFPNDPTEYCGMTVSESVI
jgi:hypothetical protein